MRRGCRPWEPRCISGFLLIDNAADRGPRVGTDFDGGEGGEAGQERGQGATQAGPR